MPGSVTPARLRSRSIAGLSSSASTTSVSAPGGKDVPHPRLIDAMGETPHVGVGDGKHPGVATRDGGERKRRTASKYPASSPSTRTFVSTKRDRGDEAAGTTDDVHAEPRLAEQRWQAGSSKPVALLHQQQHARGARVPVDAAGTQRSAWLPPPESNPRTVVLRRCRSRYSQSCGSSSVSSRRRR